MNVFTASLIRRAISGLRVSRSMLSIALQKVVYASLFAGFFSPSVARSSAIAFHLVAISVASVCEMTGLWRVDRLPTSFHMLSTDFD